MHFVGRRPELDLTLREIELSLQNSAGRTIFVEGSSGIGKTAFVQEVMARLNANHATVGIGRGRCLQMFGAAEPYLPFVDAIRDLADESTAGSIAKETVSQLIAELAPYWLSVVPLVGSLLSATYATAARLRGQSGAPPSREALFVQYLELVRKLAAASPLLLFLDDVHWADQSSVALLSHVSRGIAQLPVVVLCTLRSTEAELERHPVVELLRELERERLATRLTLNEMADDAMQSLLATEFGGDVSVALGRWMHGTVGGNPLFAAEFARLLKERGSVVHRQGEWQLAVRPESIETPRSASAVIETRIRHLAPEEIRVLQYASAEGNQFDSTIVSRLLDQDELEVLDCLERLDRQHQLVETVGELVLPDGDVATTYRFRHALVQTELYRQVVGKRRILLHRKAGETIEALYDETSDRVAGRLARHFHQGRVRDSAYRFARRAADQARMLYAHWEAEEFYDIALANSPGPAESAEIEERLGDVYDAQGYYAKGIAAYERALGDSLDRPASSLRLRRKIITLQRVAGMVAAPVLLERVKQLLDQAAEHPAERAHLLLEISKLPAAEAPIEAAQQALHIAEQIGDIALVLRAEEDLARALIFLGTDVQQALPHLHRAKSIIEQLDDPLRMEHCHTMTAILHARLGQYSDALAEFQGATVIADRLAIPQAAGTAFTNLGGLLRRMGRHPEAEEALQRAYSIHMYRDRGTMVHSLFNLAENARASGALPLAIERFREMSERAAEFEYWTSEAVAHAGLGLCLLAAGRAADAAEHAGRVAAVLGERDEWFEDRELVELFLARMDAAQGRMDAALARLERARAVLAGFDVYAWSQVELERARLLADSEAAAAAAIVEALDAATAGFRDPFAAELADLRRRLDARAAEPAPLLIAR
jgi:tetratricopeptide (TPR) repeat protein